MLDSDGHVRLILEPNRTPRVSLEVTNSTAESLAPFQRCFGGSITQRSPDPQRNRPNLGFIWISSNDTVVRRYLHYASQVPHLNSVKGRRLALLQSFHALCQLKAYRLDSPYLHC